MHNSPNFHRIFTEFSRNSDVIRQTMKKLLAIESFDSSVLDNLSINPSAFEDFALQSLQAFW